MNTSDLQSKKTEDRDKKTLSFVFAPRAGLSSKPFLNDLSRNGTNKQ
jgi:hypothetical protein